MMMSPDDLCAEILRIQEKRNPDEDPGDINICVQDDMPMVSVDQGSRLPGRFAIGRTIQEALQNYLETIK